MGIFDALAGLFGRSRSRASPVATAAAASPSPSDELISARGWTVEALLADPFQVGIFDFRGLDFCRANRAALAAGFLERAAEESEERRICLGEILLRMGEPAGGPLVLAGLESADAGVRQRALWTLARLPWRDEEGLQVPLDESAVRAALEPSLSAGDAVAARALLRLSGDDTLAEKRRLLGHRDPEVRAMAALELAIHHGDAAAWPLVSWVVAAAPQERIYSRYHFINCLGGFARCADPGVRAEAAELARRELMKLLPRSDNEAANEVYNLLRALESLAPDWEAEVLEQAAASRLSRWVRSAASRRLIVREGASAARRNIRGLDDEATTEGALRAIADLGPAVASAELIDRLHRMLRRDEEEHRLSLVADALAALGALDDPRAHAAAGRIEPWRRFAVRSYRDRRSADDLLGRLDEAGLIPAADSDARAAFRAAWDGTRRDLALLELLAAGGRLHQFDSENDQVPPDYIELLADLAALARSAFEVRGARFVGEGDEPVYELHARVAGRPVLITLRNEGDWYDVGGLLAGLNRGLAAGGVSLRYAALSTSDQIATVALLEAGALSALARELAFPFGDPEAARRLGQAFEADVVRRLGRGS